MDYEVTFIEEDGGKTYPALVHSSGLFVGAQLFLLLARLKVLYPARYQAFCHIVRAVAEEMEAQNGLQA